MRNTIIPSGKDNGFTLVELASVLGIIAVIIGMTVSSGVTMINSTKVTATQQKMAAIDQALMAYRLAYDQLPCPSDLTAVQGNAYYGTALTLSGSTTGTSGYCQNVTNTSGLYGVRTATGIGSQVTVAEGGVPVSDLGLPYEFMYDGWGNRIRYAVSVNMAYTGLNSTSNIPNNSNTFSGTQLGAAPGAITIKGDAAVPGTYNLYPRSSAAIYALISHGPNGHGAFTKSGTIQNAGDSNTDELTNCNCSSAAVETASLPSSPNPVIYVQEQPYSYNLTNPLINFDDIVTYKERWQLQAPWDTSGIAYPAVWVADASNNRIEELDMSGQYLAQYTLTNLTNPNGVTVDSMGNIWIADYGYNSVWELNSSGAFVLGIGSGYQGVGGTLGATGTATGMFHSPTAVAIDSSGNIWVADNGNNRVQEFSNTGNFMQQIPASGTTAGYIKTYFKSPYDIAVDSLGDIWVADGGNNRLQEFNSSGTWLQSVGGGSSPYACAETGVPSCTAGCATNGCLNGPTSLAADAVGNIWVSDTGNTRMEEFTNAGAYVANFNSSFSSTMRGVRVDAAGNLWISDKGNSKIKKCTNNGSGWSSPTCAVFGSSGSGNDQFSGAVGVAVTGR